MDVVRRDASHETVLGEDLGVDTQETFTPDHNRLSDMVEKEADAVFDYNKEDMEAGVDLAGDDDIYGGYGLFNASVQTPPDRPVIMIAGGTGFSPVKGLILQAMSQDANHAVHLFWGARDAQDLYMDDLVKEWTTTYPNLKYTPVLSENTSEDWQGEFGFVHEAVCRLYDNVTDFDVYASGPPVMIDAVRNSLLERGLDQQRFHFDSFDYAKPT